MATMSKIPDRSPKWLVLNLVAIGTFMSTLDAGIVTVALPTLTSVFRTGIATGQWFVLSYTFTITVLLLAFGKLGDLFGRRRLYIFGILVFSVGSAACGLSMTGLMLILSRALQGIGAAMVMSSGPAFVTEVFPPGERGKSLGFIGTAVALGLLAGPLLGGLILQYAGWRWMFFINVPIGITLALLLTLRVRGFDTNRDGTLDVRGTVLMALALASFLGAETVGSKAGWKSPITLLLFVAAAILTGIFIITERSTNMPVLDLKLFRQREFAIGAIAGWANYAATMPVAVFMPFYLSNILRMPPHIVGLMLAFGPATLAITAPVAGSLSDRIGSRFLTSIGLLTAAIGLLALRSLGPSASAANVAWRLVLASFGSAMFVSPNSSAVMGSVPRSDLGVAAGVVALVRNLGMVCGISIAGAVITTVQKSHAVTGEITNASPVIARNLGFLAGLKAAFLVSAIILIIASLISAMRIRPGDREAFEKMQ